MYVCVLVVFLCVCVAIPILANHVSFIFQKKNVARKATRRAVAATFTATATASASGSGFGFGFESASETTRSRGPNSAQKRRHDTTQSRTQTGFGPSIPSRLPSICAPSFSGSLNNNKSSCACQSLFERQPLGFQASRLAAAIGCGWCGRWWVVGWLVSPKKKLIFLLIFVPVNSKCLHSFINVSKMHTTHTNTTTTTNTHTLSVY